MTGSALLAYVKGNPSVDAPYAESCWDEASALVSRFVGSAEVPDSIVERATLEVGSELFHRKQAPSGIQGYAANDGAPPAPRLNRDPMSRVYAILGPFIPGGFA